MGSYVFRVPDTELFIRADGVFTATVGADEEVRDLTPDDTHVLEVAHFGELIQGFPVRGGAAGGGGDKFPNMNPEGRLVVRAMQQLPYGAQTIEFMSILDELVNGPPGGPDPLLESLNRLHLALAAIQDFALGAWATEREENLAFLTAHSSVALHIANDFSQSHGDRNDAVWAAKIANADTLSRLAVQTLAGNIERGYWLRPYSLAAISVTGNAAVDWMPHLEDRAEQNAYHQVWDYRWAQPVLEYAIVARLMVMTAFSTGSAAENALRCQEIASYVGVLQKVFSKRWSGLRSLTQLNARQRQWYSHTGRFPVAVVDIYGGDYLAGYYFNSDMQPSRFAPGMAPPYLDSFTHPSRPLDLTWVDNNVKAFASHWWNLLYLRTGLEDLLLLISEMQVVCDAPLFAKTFTDVHRKVYELLDDEDKRRAAQLAAGLSASARGLERPERAALTHQLYVALSGEGERTRSVVDRAIRDLVAR